MRLSGKLLLVFLLILIATPLHAQPVPEGAGMVAMPYIYGDGGIVALRAGATIPATWHNPPPGALVYLLLWHTYMRPIPPLLGIDLNADDGVVVQWKVPERISGYPYGIAIYADGTLIVSDNRRSGLEYGSGTGAPEGFCSVDFSGFDNIPLIYPQINDAFENRIGEIDGYAEVLDDAFDEQGVRWLQIALSEDNVGGVPDTDPPPPTGWIEASRLRFHGECSFLTERL